MIVGRLAPFDQWDQTILEHHLLVGAKWVEGYPNTDGPVALVIPGRYWHERTAEISAAIARYPHVTAFLVGDEENLLDVDAVQHPAVTWWVQTPQVGRSYPAGTRFLPAGWTPHFTAMSAEPPTKDVDLFLAGQLTHARRAAAFEGAERVECGIKIIHPTDGFTRGMPAAEYRDLMMRTKVAPCPAGAVSPDSFRVWEALEAHAVPVVDDMSPVRPSAGFWNLLAPDAPFPILVSWPKLHRIAHPVLDDWPHSANHVVAWWMRQKAVWRDTLVDQGPITVVVPVSPIPSHPGTEILDETIASIRHHLPDAPIIVTFDGCRPEDEARHVDYDEHIRRALWRLDKVHGNIRPYLYDHHRHQTGMMRAILPDIATPLVMYVEHDAPLVTDEPIDFELIATFLLAGRSDSVRLYHEAHVPDVHQYLMHGHDSYRSVQKFLMTSQWSQRPHVATTAFYRRIIETCFTEDARSFIEDRMHGIAHEAHVHSGMLGWQQYRLHIYDPGGGNMKRSYHTDGRNGSAKYDETQVF